MYIVKAKFSINVLLRSFLQLFITITFDLQWQITKLKNTTWRLVSEMWTKTVDRGDSFENLRVSIRVEWFNILTLLHLKNVNLTDPEEYACKSMLSALFCHKHTRQMGFKIIRYTIMPDPDFFELIKIVWTKIETIS